MKYYACTTKMTLKECFFFNIFRNAKSSFKDFNCCGCQGCANRLWRGPWLSHYVIGDDAAFGCHIVSYVWRWSSLMRVEFLLQRVFVKIITHMIVFDQNLLGNEDVGVVIHESLIYSEAYLTQRFLLQGWPLRDVMLEGVSLHDHSWCHMQIQEEFQANMRPRKSLWKYDSMACVPHTANECKCQKLHTK